MDRETIKKNVVEHLYWDQRVDAAGISVEVGDGVVRLSGTVPSALSRASAEYDAWVVDGVDRVRNELIVDYPGSGDFPTAEELRGEIERTLLWNPHVDAKKIEVEIHGGTAVLTGEVDAYWKKARVVELVSEVIGVLGVEDRLAVNPRRKLNDEDIAESVAAALKRDRTIAHIDVGVTVRDGVVELNGWVPGPGQVSAVERIAAHTPGVTGVKNNLVEKQAAFADH